MRPDMMIVEMTAAEQQQYMRYGNNSGSRQTPLTPMMPSGNSRSIKIVEGGYCISTDYERLDVYVSKETVLMRQIQCTPESH